MTFLSDRFRRLLDFEGTFALSKSRNELTETSDSLFLDHTSTLGLCVG